MGIGIAIYYASMRYLLLPKYLIILSPSVIKRYTMQAVEHDVKLCSLIITIMNDPSCFCLY